MIRVHTSRAFINFRNLIKCNLTALQGKLWFWYYVCKKCIYQEETRNLLSKQRTEVECDVAAEAMSKEAELLPLEVVDNMAQCSDVVQK